MTVASEAWNAELAWTGVETLFTTGILAQDVSHISLSFRGADDTLTTLTNGVHLTLIKAGVAGATGAITATPIDLPAAPGTVIFERVTPALQGTPFADLTGYSATVHERLHDAAALRAAELRDGAGVAISAAAAAAAVAAAAGAVADTAAAVEALLIDGVVVARYATGGDGSQGNPWTGWDTAITWAPFTTYRFRTGWYAYATSPNFLKSGIQLIGDAGVYLKHTGTGDVFTMDAGSVAGSAWIQGARVENINLIGNTSTGTGTASVSSGSAAVLGVGTAFLTEFAVGNAITFRAGTSIVETKIISAIADNTHLTTTTNFAAAQSGAFKIGKSTNGFFLRGVRNAVFNHCSAHDVHKAGVWTEACVTNILSNFRCTYHEPLSATYFNCRPRYGIVTTGRGVDWSTCWTITNPVIEGMGLDGIWFAADSYGNTLINGTSEGNVEAAIGILVAGNFNVITNTDVEANNSSIDVSITGSYNTFHGLYSTTLVTCNGSLNTFGIGHYQNLTITQSGGSGYNNLLLSPQVLGTLTDTGNATRYLGITGSDFRAKLGVVLPEFAALTISAGAVATNAALADLFLISVDQNFTLSNPTNGTIAGQRFEWRLLVDSGGPYTLSYGTQFRAANGGALLTTLAASGVYYFVGRLNTTDNKIDLLITGSAGGVGADLTAIEALTGTGLAARTAADTWALRSLTAPAAGITVTNPAGVAGNPTLVLANDLAALEALSSTGLISRTASETYAQRTITAPAAGITVSNGDGVSGNPTLVLANDLAALEALSSTGLAARTASDTWAQRTITGTAAEITVTNGDGVSGNPTLSLPSAITLTGKTLTGGSFVTPALGVTTATSLAVNGATIGTDAVSITGSLKVSTTVLALGALTVQGSTANDSIALSTTGTITAQTNAGGIKYQIVAGADPGVRLASGFGVGFNSTTTLASGAIDTSVSRVSAGVVGIGTGASGSVAGTLSAAVLKTGSYTVGTVPSASTAGAGAMIYVSNEAGGATTAFSDATDWRRHADRAIIS